MKNKKLLNQLAYFGIMIIAIVFIIAAVLKQMNVSIDFVNTVLDIAQNVAMLFMILVISFVGWEYAKRQPTVWKIIFLVAAILAVATSAFAIVN